MDKILIIEDEKVVRETLVDMLTLHGFDVSSAKNGNEGVSKYIENLPDLVVSDIMMPGMTGYEVLEEIKKIPASANVPFIFLSAVAGSFDVREGMNMGADDYLTKPFKMKELVKTIKARLEKKKKAEKRINELTDSIARNVPHEFRTPLVSILGMSRFIKEEIENLSKHDISEMIDRVIVSGERMHRIVERFLYYTDCQLMQNDVDIYKDIISSTTDNISDMVWSSFNKNANNYKRHEDLQVDIQNVGITIHKDYLQFVVDEIIDNAIKFSKINDPIKIEGRVVEDEYLLSFTDEGVGMTPDQLIDVGLFVKHAENILNQHGNGMGLITSKKIIELFNGELSIFSEYNKFTTILIKLKISNK